MTNANIMGLLLVSAGALVAGCGDSTTGSGGSTATGVTSTGVTSATGATTGAGTPTVTVKNTLSWCDVTVTVGTGTPTSFKTASQAFPAAAGTVIKLNAVPNPTFFAVKWTGVTTMTGADATYTVSGDPTQTVTACCPTDAAGTGC